MDFSALAPQFRVAKGRASFLPPCRGQGTGGSAGATAPQRVRTTGLRTRFAHSQLLALKGQNLQTVPSPGLRRAGRGRQLGRGRAQHRSRHPRQPQPALGSSQLLLGERLTMTPGRRKGWEREETWERRRGLLKTDRIRARDGAGSPAAGAAEATPISRLSQELLSQPPRCPPARPGHCCRGARSPGAVGTAPGLGFGTQLPAGSGAEAGDGPVPALLGADELRAAQGVFRNPNRMCPRCQPATRRYQA